MSHIRVDAMRGQSRANSITGVALGLALLAPLMTRPDALLVSKNMDGTYPRLSLTAICRCNWRPHQL